MRKRQIHIVVGARPNFIKANPVFRELEKTGQFDLILVNTGQHYDDNLSKIFFYDLEMKQPDINLNVGSATHGKQTALILEKYEKVLLETNPDLVIVFGDVNSTIACSLAAVKLHIPVAHVEAGLRSFDRTMPEEINRILTDQISEFLFTTCRDADFNLINEGIAEEKIHFVGNTMIDTLVAFEEHFNASNIHKILGLNGSYALITFHRPSNVDSESGLIKLVQALEETAEIVPCVFPVHPRTKQNLKNYDLFSRLNTNTKFQMIEPIGYIDFMRLQRDASVVLTDSGGIQEETTYFGVPCLTVRDNTERPITIEKGTNKLVGTDYSKIAGTVRETITQDKKFRIPELWDGRAFERITEVLFDFIL